MSRSSTRRAQTEPIAALVAVLAVGVGLTAYAGVLDTTLESVGRNVAEPALECVHDATSEGGVVRPEAIAAGADAGPAGYRTNVTITSGGKRWHAGPPAPAGVDRAERLVSVALDPGVVRPGRLRVVVWS